MRGRLHVASSSEELEPALRRANHAVVKVRYGYNLIALTVCTDFLLACGLSSGAHNYRTTFVEAACVAIHVSLGVAYVYGAGEVNE